ncbi:ERD1 (YDR414C) [Zygosaccharomyces parabailii]|uniref:ZYBA0S05-04126g1_1 n=1 Tax=Zygosaccharomyces bailii (strain CLIB 213 / ATCC 58445 / CBS 680 / BCRC 21525 / NBRC 1098 / NCYC 1416 / NRRL Y-2227) TaxID=1333698 RepID=A0A8J2T6M9_ZYGB2|nr:ERD1 (YDR414C) [Zygosaccharomyces parabailii]CDF89890.1 ZYBA0S05-04126g1_1 [Zygosaccharomyces bailii CLIB 213]CDH17648.1 related to Protein ERD1 [Zygosaccharomyces bailii ISA1307]
MRTYTLDLNFVGVLEESEQKAIMPGKVYVAGSERISLLVLLGTCMWCWILSWFASYHLDLSGVVQTRLPHELKAPLTHLQLQKASKEFTISLWARVAPLLALGILLHPIAENFPVLFIVEHCLPLLEFAVIIWYLLKRSPILSYCARRILLIEPKPKELRNVYILLSDSLTSFSKPLIDFSLYMTAFLFDTYSHLDLAVAMIPVSIRMFQCAREYYLTRDKQHIWNFVKYSTNVPILVCVWYSRVQPDKFQYGTQLWFMLLNASYTFYWDVFIDWKLESVLKLRSKGLDFPSLVYYTGICIDFVIKYWWLWTLHSGRSALFFPSEIQYLEILRRAVWVFFKLDAERSVG